jgi:hypothetical protein
VADQRDLGFQGSVSNRNALLTSGSRRPAVGFRRRCVTNDSWSGFVLTDVSVGSDTPAARVEAFDAPTMLEVGGAAGSTR